MTKLWIFTIVLDRSHIYLHWNSLKMLINIRITYFFFPFNNNSCIAVFGEIVPNAANIPIPQPLCRRYELLLHYVWTTYGIKRIYFRRFSITKYIYLLKFQQRDKHVFIIWLNWMLNCFLKFLKPRRKTKTFLALLIFFNTEIVLIICKI